jgi:hypothetical protein
MSRIAISTLPMLASLLVAACAGSPSAPAPPAKPPECAACRPESVAMAECEHNRAMCSGPCNSVDPSADASCQAQCTAAYHHCLAVATTSCPAQCE